jgi:hypothetical protein
VLLGLVAATLVATVGMTACLTDPPPDLPLQSQAPSIVQTATQPAEGVITSLPPNGLFVVPIGLADPTENCQFSVFDQYNDYFACRPCDTASFDAGTVTVEFTLGTAQFDPTLCHTLKFTVGSSFSPADTQCRSGSDIAIWDYRPPNASCVTYDAAALGDGSFPEAADDALPLVPDSWDEP